MAPKSTRMLHDLLAATFSSAARRLNKCVFRLQALRAKCLDLKHVAARHGIFTPSKIYGTWTCHSRACQVRRSFARALLDAMWLPLTRLVALDGALPVSGVSQGHISMLPDNKPAKFFQWAFADLSRWHMLIKSASLCLTFQWSLQEAQCMLWVSPRDLNTRWYMLA